jgi:retron-type reverse transcriptase
VFPTQIHWDSISKMDGQVTHGMPSWSDKLLQEVIRQLLEAYYELQFSPHAHGFRTGWGYHTALQEITQHWCGVKWFIEGQICSFYDRIDHSILVNKLREKIHNNRFIRLIEKLLQAGYLEDWQSHTTYRRAPQAL